MEKPGPKPIPLGDRIWDKVDKSGECWVWTRATVRGYGVLMSQGRQHYAHRVVWEQEVGPIPIGYVILHACDNPPCVRPDHLRIGTQADNIRDAAAKARTSHGQGRRNHKVSDDQVREMRRLRASGLNARQMADRFPIGERTIRKILAGRNWKHLQDHGKT